MDTVSAGFEDKDRYDRQRRIAWMDMDSISSANVLVAGAGALGNEVVKNLVLSGFRRITVVDMDDIVISNFEQLAAKPLASGDCGAGGAVSAARAVPVFKQLPRAPRRVESGAGCTHEGV